MRALNLSISILLLIVLAYSNLQFSHADGRLQTNVVGAKKNPFGSKQLPAEPKPVDRPIVGKKHIDRDDITSRTWRDLGDRAHDLRRCHSPYNQNLAAPYINIYEVRKIGNLLSEKYRVKGSIEGVCVAEAGYFEQGKKVEDFRFQTSPVFARYEFETTVRSSRSPEIRVYNSNGERNVYRVQSRGPRDEW